MPQFPSDSGHAGSSCDTLHKIEFSDSLYSKRYRIETFFSDQKTRGFHLDKSHIDDPKRLSRLMIAACLAYIWIVFLGTLAILEGWVPVIHRTDRCDLSLFPDNSR
jgi:hypothetical protein